MKRIFAAALALTAAPIGSVWAQAVAVGQINLQPAGASDLTGASTLYLNASDGTQTSAALNWSGACTTCSGWSASGSGAGFVTNGAFGDRATLTVAGSPPSAPAWVYSETASTYSDTFTIGGGTGSGVLALEYSVDGTLNAGSGYVAFGLSSAPAGSDSSLNGAAYSAGTLANMIATPGAQNDSLSVQVPFTYGTSFTITPVLVGAALYTGGTATPATSALDFYNTMTLDSALVYGGAPSALGSENDSAVINASTGLLYGADGVSAVPIPATSWLLLSALGALAVVGRRRLTH